MHSKHQKTQISQLDAQLYSHYKRPFDKPKPKFQSVPIQEYPSKWYQTIGYCALLLLVNLFIFGFFCLMLYLRFVLTTGLFVRIGVGVVGSAAGISIVLMYFMGLERKQQEREMFNRSNQKQHQKSTNISYQEINSTRNIKIHEGM